MPCTRSSFMNGTTRFIIQHYTQIHYIYSINGVPGDIFRVAPLDDDATESHPPERRSERLPNSMVTRGEMLSRANCARIAQNSDKTPYYAFDTFVPALALMPVTAP